ncbi:MAG: hypothetical protein AABY26_03320 [Nanoarchaeota archaeon]
MDEEIKNLVKKRLSAMPPDVSFSIGGYGDFTRDELIKEVDKDSKMGQEIIEMQLNFIRSMPSLLKKNALHPN